MYNYKLAVVIGRFQPFHNGHESVIRCALQQADEVIVLVGSCDKPRSYKNPWTYNERVEMIKGTLPEFSNRIVYSNLVDYPYNNRKWVCQVNNKVFCYMQSRGVEDKVVLVGHDKDNSSFYLKMFPGYNVINCENHQDINATDIRKKMFYYPTIDEYFKSVISPQTNKVIENSIKDNYLVHEAAVIEEYKESWSKSPFPPTLVCVDSVVFSEGKVLMVKRAQAPGKDLWALPGGFVDGKETLYEAAVRELLEETGYNLKGFQVVNSKTFDHPDRGERGRTFTTAFNFNISSIHGALQRTDGEASEIQWFPINAINGMSNVIYQDHKDIIQYFNNNYNGVVDESHFGY